MRKIENRILIGLAITISVFAAWVCSPFADVELAGTINGIAQILLSLACIVFGFYIAAKSTFPLPLRRAWGLLTLGVLSGSIGQIVGIYFMVATGTVPLLSLADTFYLMSYPLVLAGILSLPYAPTRREQRLLLNLDLIIVVVTSAVFLWHFIVANLMKAGASSLPNLVSIAYPIGDLLILGGMASLIQRDVEGIARTILITVSSSMLLFILGDIMYAALVTYAVDTSSFLWRIGGILFLVSRFGFLAATIWQATTPHLETIQTQSFLPLLRTNMVYLAILSGTGLALVVLASLLRSNLHLYITLLGVISISVLVLLRQFFVLQDNRRLNREVEQLAVTDALTGLSNRRFFDDVLAREVGRAQRYNRPLSVLLTDIDDFKKYNDRYGHPQGDRLLQDIAQLLRRQLRANDVAARYGGDEFVIILPETNLEKSRKVADKLHEVVKTVLARDEVISVSIGCAAFQLGMTTATLLELADQDMYREKPYHARR